MTSQRQFVGPSTILFQLWKTLSLVWAASHYWTLTWIALLMIQGLLPIASVYLTRWVVNQLVSAVGKGFVWEQIQPLLIPVGLMAGILVLTELLQGVSEWIRTAQSELVQDHISALIQDQSMQIDLGCYESSEYNDQLNRAREGASSRSLALLENTGNLLQNSITVLAIAAVLIPYGFWLPIALLLSAMPAFYVALRLNWQQYEWSQRTTTDRRRLQYYDLLLTQGIIAAELRLFNFGAYFQTAYRALRQRLRAEQLNLIRDQSLGRLGASTMALLVSGMALLWMGYQVLRGRVTLGDLALFYQAFNQGQGIVKSLLGNLGQIYRNSLYIRNLFEFLQINPQIVDPPQLQPVPSPLTQGIRFRDITFRYPGSQDTILEGFNLTIPSGKIVAIVGDNGAGKSTLIKLLCRFYDPERGSVELDGIDLRQFAVADLRRQITVLFQFPATYQVTAAQNIALSDLSLEAQPSQIEAAARASGIHDKITRLSRGYDSMLGRWFPEGTDLSGGEWQRLALARAFFRQASIVILDEPTSAMDPWAECDWLDRFRQLAVDRTALVITHRFTLAMRADIIHVMRQGRILESGSHEQLLSQNGLYAQSWQAQMQSYTRDVEREANTPAHLGKTTD